MNSPLILGRDKINTFNEPLQGSPPVPMQLSHIPLRDFLPPTDNESFRRHVLALGDKFRLDPDYSESNFKADMRAVLDAAISRIGGVHD